ncbi:hypothetical protein [Lentzea sp.]
MAETLTIARASGCDPRTSIYKHIDGGRLGGTGARSDAVRG